MTPLTFTVPAEFSDPRVYERIGAVIKELATGRIAGHVQELGGWSLVRNLPIPGGNPLALVVKAAELIADGIQIAQLEHLRQVLNVVRSLASVGAVASVASFGVSVGGFAIVMSKLNRMDGKLDRLLGEAARVRKLVESLHVKVDALPMARLRAALEAVELALHYDPVRRREELRRSIAKLSELRHHYALLLADAQFCSLGTENLLALLDTHERLVAACNGELVAEFHLSGSAQLIENRWNLQRELLENVAWRTPAELYELAEQGDHDAGVWMVTPAAARRAKVEALTQVRRESVNRLASVAPLASLLEGRGVSADAYVRELQRRSNSDEPLTVIDARG
jgi:hypothetical protein